MCANVSACVYVYVYEFVCACEGLHMCRCMCMCVCVHAYEGLHVRCICVCACVHVDYRSLKEKHLQLLGLNVLYTTFTLRKHRTSSQAPRDLQPVLRCFQSWRDLCCFSALPSSAPGPFLVTPTLSPPLSTSSSLSVSCLAPRETATSLHPKEHLDWCHVVVISN